MATHEDLLHRGAAGRAVTDVCFAQSPGSPGHAVVYPRICGGTTGEAKAGDARGVFPRRCGGTRGRRYGEVLREGLSPQVRGNPPLRSADGRAEGSIPAGAGEPKRQNVLRNLSRVYPRRCGGTPAKQSAGGGDEGLSPQVRGNLGRYVRMVLRFGSIPAGAGEPACSLQGLDRHRVYPRRCGGTVTARRPSS